MFLNLIQSNKFRPFSGACPKSVCGMQETVDWSTIVSFKEKRLHPKLKLYIINRAMEYYQRLKWYLSFFLRYPIHPKMPCFWPPDVCELSSMLDLRWPDWPLYSHCSAHAQLPNITALPLRLASEACHCMLIATRVESRAKAEPGFMWGFTACEQQFPPPPPLFFPFLPTAPSLPLIWDMLGLVITEQMNLLTPKLDLWDSDISDVSQCFTHVHVCLFSLENRLHPEESLCWAPAPGPATLHTESFNITFAF